MAILKYKGADGTYKTLTNYAVNSPSVVQTTGTSTTTVMSQKAATDAFTSKATGDYLYSNMTEWTPTTATTSTQANDMFKKSCLAITVDSSQIGSAMSTFLPTEIATLGGPSLHMIIMNTTSSDISVTIPAANANVVACNGDVLNIKANAVGEINIIRSGSKLYYRIG